MDGVIDPDVFRDAVLRPSSSGDVDLAADGARTELLPGAGELCLGNDLLGFVVNLKNRSSNNSGCECVSGILVQVNEEKIAVGESSENRKVNGWSAVLHPSATSSARV